MLAVSTLEDWTRAVATELGLADAPAGADGFDDPQGADLIDRDLALDLACDVAHGVARPAAPLTTYLVGLAAGLAAARAGSFPADWDRATRTAASRVSALAAAWGPAPED